MVTLHAYVLRELLRSFGVTLAALTALFTMGGGLYNVVRHENVSPLDVFRALPLLIPIVVTLTMPIAALFSTTMVYGRLAADNELTACRAAGVNIHRLFLAGVLLSIFVTLFTLLSGNYVIPDFMRRIDRFARSNLRDIALQQLRAKGHIRYGTQYYMTAERVADVSARALRQRHFEVGPGLSYLWTYAPTYLQLDRNGEVTRFTTAQEGLVQFDARSTPIQITSYVLDARDFEIGKRAVQIRQQQLGPIELQIPFPNRPSWADLTTLLRWRAAPWEIHDVQAAIQTFLAELCTQRFYADSQQRLRGGQKLMLLGDEGQRYEVSAAQSAMGTRQLVLQDARVEVSEPERGLPTIYEAPRAELIARAAPPGVEIRLLPAAQRSVLEYNPRAGQYHAPRAKPVLSLDGVAIPQSLQDEIRSYSPRTVLDRAAHLPVLGGLREQRAKLQKDAERHVRKINSLIHFRLAYAGSALVTILMGAALGVAFRGARALAAFGLACIPFGTVTILVMMGRQLGEKEGTAAIGPLIIWGGLAVVALADGLILRLGVRR